MRPPRQIGWVISVEDWALIRRLVADGVPQRQVARQLGIGRSTVARAVASAAPPKYERRPVTTSFAAFEPRVRALLAEFPEMPATVIADRIGWDGSILWFARTIASGLADHHTMALPNMRRHAVKAEDLHHRTGRHPEPMIVSQLRSQILAQRFDDP